MKKIELDVGKFSRLVTEQKLGSTKPPSYILDWAEKELEKYKIENSSRVKNIR